MNNWQIISTFTYPHEAHMAKTYLESEGIDVVMQDELTAQVNNFYSNTIGGVKLLIPESDFEQGLQLLKKGGFIQIEAAQEIETILVDKTIDKTHCPFCQSENIGKKKQPNILTIVLYFILGALFPILEVPSPVLIVKRNGSIKKLSRTK
jgi:VIT1/CCC1 family predicted Fe2+/Mn2+ transporter